MSIEDKAVEIISQLQALGPQVTDLALTTARIGALDGALNMLHKLALDHRARAALAGAP